MHKKIVQIQECPHYQNKVPIVFLHAKYEDTKNLSFRPSFRRHYWTIQRNVSIPRIFASVFEGYWTVVIFFCNIFVCFWYSGNSGRIKLVRRCSCFCYFQKEFRQNCFYFLLKCLKQIIGNNKPCVLDTIVALQSYACPDPQNL